MSSKVKSKPLGGLKKQYGTKLEKDRAKKTYVEKELKRGLARGNNPKQQQKLKEARQETFERRYKQGKYGLNKKP